MGVQLPEYSALQTKQRQTDVRKHRKIHEIWDIFVGQSVIIGLNFRMWDVDDSGSINVTEMTNIIATMDDVEGVEQDPKVTHKSSL